MALGVDEQYLALCRRILETGSKRADRTGMGTISKFGERIEVDLTQGFPLLTTKRIYWNAVVRELLWFISGSTDAKELSKKGVHIWDGHTSREYLDSRGLSHYPEGCVGPSYGWQWRHAGALFPGTTTQGIDQLAEIIEKIKKDPTDRRLIVSAWNVSDLKKMALPPCHILFQFYVEEDERLSCQVYQRSADVPLGLPFNIASYALLTHIVAHLAALKGGVGRLILCLGDAHIYTNQVEGINIQLKRTPRSLPRIRISPRVMNIDDITEMDILLEDYDPLPAIAMQMTV